MNIDNINNCEFCNKELNTIEVNIKKSIFYKTKVCYNHSPLLIKYSKFHFSISNEIYSLVNTHHDNKWFLQVLHPNYLKINLDFDPNITPENFDTIISKIKNLLLFL